MIYHLTRTKIVVFSLLTIFSLMYPEKIEDCIENTIQFAIKAYDNYSKYNSYGELLDSMNEYGS